MRGGALKLQSFIDNLKNGLKDYSEVQDLDLDENGKKKIPACWHQEAKVP